LWIRSTVGGGRVVVIASPFSESERSDTNPDTRVYVQVMRAGFCEGWKRSLRDRELAGLRKAASSYQKT